MSAVRDVAVVALGVTLGLLVLLGALMLVNPRAHSRRSRRSQVMLLGLPPGRPLHERVDYPSGDEGVYAIHGEMRLWLGIVAGLADLTAVAPLIEAAYLPAGVSR
ncbi:hypothetical protein [Micromonospora profundi]|uniref:hypothetical protein n=1 Tax=Micromonospora profundi TaxID=1420889 RepID=UPI00365C65A3